MTHGLDRMGGLAKRDKDARFTSLACHINMLLLVDSVHSLDGNLALGLNDVGGWKRTFDGESQ